MPIFLLLPLIAAGAAATGAIGFKIGQFGAPKSGAVVPQSNGLSAFQLGELALGGFAVLAAYKVLKGL